MGEVSRLQIRLRAGHDNLRVQKRRNTSTIISAMFCSNLGCQYRIALVVVAIMTGRRRERATAFCGYVTVQSWPPMRSARIALGAVSRSCRMKRLCTDCTSLTSTMLGAIRTMGPYFDRRPSAAKDSRPCHLCQRIQRELAAGNLGPGILERTWSLDQYNIWQAWNKVNIASIASAALADGTIQRVVSIMLKCFSCSTADVWRDRENVVLVYRFNAGV